MIARWSILSLILAATAVMASDPAPSSPPFDPITGPVDEPGFWYWAFAHVVVAVVFGCALLFVRWWNKRHPEPGEQK